MKTIKMTVQSLKTSTAAFAGLLLAVSLVAAPAPPATAADSGDGLIACNNGEICFRWLSSSDAYIKHFWYDANHSGNYAHNAYYFWSVPSNKESLYRLTDNAEGLRNRDTTCTVYLWDVNASGGWYTYNYQSKQATSFANIVGNRNNGHSRCSNGSPVNR